MLLIAELVTCTVIYACCYISTVKYIICTVISYKVYVTVLLHHSYTKSHRNEMAYQRF